MNRLKSSLQYFAVTQLYRATAFWHDAQYVLPARSRNLTLPQRCVMNDCFVLESAWLIGINKFEYGLVSAADLLNALVLKIS